MNAKKADTAKQQNPQVAKDAPQTEETPRYNFNPEPGITAYELATIMATMGMFVDHSVLAKLSPEAQRHFK